MSDSCRVWAYLLAEAVRADAHLSPTWNIPLRSCSGPLVECLLGVTKEAVEKAAPHGIWRSPATTSGGPAISFPALLTRLSTQECPRCKGYGGFVIQSTKGPLKCHACSGTGRVGTVVCERHRQLLDDGKVRWEDIIPAENLALLQGLGLVESAGQVKPLPKEVDR